MEWMRYHPKVAAAAAAVVTLFVIVGVWKLAGGKSHDQGPGAAYAPLPTATAAPLTKLPSATTSATPTAKPTGSVEKAFAGGLKGLSTGGGGGSAKGGTLQMPGLQGGSMYKYLPKHHITLRVTSQQPIGTVGYIMPTSLNESSGVRKNVGTAWSLNSIVYGDPDYAQIFVQAGARGYPVTCTITVDGRVTEHRSTEGPYGQLVCQG
jgi:hypothetical protein